MTADVLRRLVVGRVREANLALLQEEIKATDAELKKAELAVAEWEEPPPPNAQATTKKNAQKGSKWGMAGKSKLEGQLAAAAAPESAQQGADEFVMVGQKKGVGTPGSGKAVAGKWGAGVQGGGGPLRKGSQQSRQAEDKDNGKDKKSEKEKEAAEEDPAEEEEETPFAKYTRLDEALTSLRTVGALEVEAKCELMARPGVVMGEDELQALADVRGACVQVRTVVCVRESSDFGASLAEKNYFPRCDSFSGEAHPATRLEGQGFGDAGWMAGELGRGGPYCVETPVLEASGVNPANGRYRRDATLVLLQEARAHRMSHFQLLKIHVPPPLPPPPPPSS